MVNKVRVNIAGTPYAIATTDPEKYIQSLAKKLDEDITKLLDANENLSVTKAAVFCAMDYLDEYRKYRDYIPRYDSRIWTATPWYCGDKNFDTGYAYDVRYVGTDGQFRSSNARASCAVVPACILNPKSLNLRQRMAYVEEREEKENETD